MLEALLLFVVLCGGCVVVDLWSISVPLALGFSAALALGFGPALWLMFR